MAEAIIEAVAVEKSYPQSDGTRIQVVGSTNLAIESGKIARDEQRGDYGYEG